MKTVRTVAAWSGALALVFSGAAGSVQAQDCNSNGVQDLVELAAGSAADCQLNDQPDDCELSGNDCNGNGVPDECETDGASVTINQHTGPLSVGIPQGFLVDTIQVTTGGTIADLNVVVDILHDNASELLIWLERGTVRKRLWEHNCAGTTVTRINGVFDDDIPYLVVCASTMIALLPSTDQLSYWDGRQASGPWALIVQDAVPNGNAGALLGWGLTIRTTAGAPVSDDCNHNHTPDACEADCDNDGTPDACEADGDHDGSPDDCDGCASDANKTAPGVCGCGVADADTDGDGVADCVDNCPSVANSDQADSDGDNVGDACPGEGQVAPACGCGATSAALMASWVLCAVKLARRRRTRLKNHF